MRNVPANGGATLPPKTKHVKQKVSAETSPHQPASAEPVLDPGEDDDATGLQLDLEREIIATVAGLSILSVLFSVPGTTRIVMEKPLLLDNVSELSKHLLIGLNSALERVQARREHSLASEEKGGQ